MRFKLVVLFLLLFSTTLIFAQFTEDFDGAVFPPTGWIANGTVRVDTTPHTAPYCVEFDANEDELISPLLTDPGQIVYHHKKVTGNYQFFLQYSSSQDGPWTTLPDYPIFAGNGWTEQTVDLSAYTNIYLRWIPQALPPGAKVFLIDTITVGSSTTPEPPTIPPINVTFPYVGVYQLQITWTRGNGDY